MRGEPGVVMRAHHVVVELLHSAHVAAIKGHLSSRSASARGQLLFILDAAAILAPLALHWAPVGALGHGLVAEALVQLAAVDEG